MTRAIKLVVLVLAMVSALTLVPVALADEGDIPGPVESDQTAYAVDEVVINAPAPIPMSPTGPAPPGTYTTELWSEGETDTENGLYVVSSSAQGTAALTGVVQDEATGDPITSATVRLGCPGDAPEIITDTNAGGGFAFINIATGACYTLTVSVPGYGTFQSINATYGADEQYEITVELNATAQLEDESVTTAAVSQTQAGTESAPIGAHTRVPPAIRVGKVVRNTDCTYSYTPDPLPVVNYKWDFYVLHVLRPEVGGLGYNQAAMRGFEGMVQNYGWYHKLVGGVFDVDWSARYQCFKPRARVARTWRTWLGDVLDERVADAAGRITETLYEKGSYLAANCAPDSKHPPDGGLGSQLGISSLTTLASCGPIGDWRNVIGYYYVPSVVSGHAPPNPVTSFSRPPGAVSFTFQSYAGIFHLAWGYELDKKVGAGSWTRIYRRGWSRRARAVPTSWTYTPPGGQCAKYRARAYNPVGYSVYSSFNAGTQICPG